MQRAFLTKLVGASALALGLTVLPASISSAQTAAPGTGTTGTTTDTVPPASDTTVETDNDTYAEDDRDFDWGWLGLLGLLGLAGLARKHDDTVTRYREPDEVSSSSSTTNRY